MFQGFSSDAGSFYWELLFHNERPWFAEHKDEFIRLLKEPLSSLAEDTLALVREAYPERDWIVHVSRIYRDARRLFGRGPYKEHLWFTIRERNVPEELGFWFEISPSSYAWGMGAFASASEMERWRTYVDADIARVTALAERFQKQKLYALDGDVYKRAKGERGELLNPWYNARTLSITARRDFGGVLLTPELPQFLAKEYTWLMPYYDAFKHLFD